MESNPLYPLYPLYPRLPEEIRTEIIPGAPQPDTSFMPQPQPVAPFTPEHTCLTCGFVTLGWNPQECQNVIETIVGIEQCRTPRGYWKCHGCFKENCKIINYCECGLKRDSTFADAQSKIVGSDMWREIHDVVQYSWQWQCSACTYSNETCKEPTSQTKCELCETKMNL